MQHRRPALALQLGHGAPVVDRWAYESDPARQDLPPVHKMNRLPPCGAGVPRWSAIILFHGWHAAIAGWCSLVTNGLRQAWLKEG